MVKGTAAVRIMVTMLSIMLIIVSLRLIYVSNIQSKNIIGTSRGYSGCDNCGDTWNWKKYHIIDYSETSGMFPLCEECYQKLDIEKVKHYVRKLAEKGNKSDRDDYNLEEMLEYAYKIIDKEKGGEGE